MGQKQLPKDLKAKRGLCVTHVGAEVLSAPMKACPLCPRLSTLPLDLWCSPKRDKCCFFTSHPIQRSTTVLSLIAHINTPSVHLYQPPPLHTAFPEPPGFVR